MKIPQFERSCFQIADSCCGQKKFRIVIGKKLESVGGKSYVDQWRAESCTLSRS